MIIFLVILSILIVVHEFGHLIMAKKLGVKVENFSLGFGPKIASRLVRGTEYSISAIPLGGYVKLAGDNSEEYKGASNEYLSKRPLERAAIVFFGPCLNYFLGFLCIWAVLFLGYPTLTTKVGGVIDNFGAKEAGIVGGDRIIAIDSRKVSTWEELQAAVQEASRQKHNDVNLRVIKDNKEFAVRVKLKERKLDDLLGDKRNMALLGITPSDDFIKTRYGFMKAFVLSADRTWQLTDLTYRALGRMITGKLSLRKSLSGPLGIYMVTQQAAHMGFSAVLNLIGILSISLAIFNLLPLPALDGGHLLFLAIEKIRRRQLSAKAERIVTQIGFGLIIFLAVFVTYNDVVRIFGDKIAKLFTK